MPKSSWLLCQRRSFVPAPTRSRWLGQSLSDVPVDECLGIGKPVPQPPRPVNAETTRTAFRSLVCLWALLALLSAGGCVQRRLTIRSNPPGALVYIDKHEIGRTPCSVEYIYYGTREIKVVKDGFETLTVMQWIPPVWYEIPGIDFISETLVPWELRDERTFNYQLVPTRVVPTGELLGRAENLRQATKFERMQAGPPMPPPPRRQVPVGPPPQAPMLAPPGGPGYFMQPGPTPNYVPGPGYMVPGNYPQPGMYPQPELLPTPGPMPPRGPQ